MIYLAFCLWIIVAWIANIVHLLRMPEYVMNGELIGRILGVVVAPVSMILPFLF